MVAAVVFFFFAAQAPPCTILVADLDGRGLPPDAAHLAPAVTGALVAAVAESSGCRVLTSADAAFLGVDPASDVERVVLGSLSRLGKQTVLRVHLLDVTRATLIAQAEAGAADEDGLRSATSTVAQQLLSGPQQEEKKKQPPPSSSSSSRPPLSRTTPRSGALFDAASISTNNPLLSLMSGLTLYVSIPMTLACGGMAGVGVAATGPTAVVTEPTKSLLWCTGISAAGVALGAGGLYLSVDNADELAR